MSRLTQLARQSWALALVAALVAAVAVEGLYHSGLGNRFEHFYTDLWHRVAGQRYMPSRVALVMLDDPTLNERPDEPLSFWTPHFAKAAATLQAVGAKVVAIDFLFSGSPERWLEKLGLGSKEAARNYDQPFRQQINQGGVILAGFRVGEGQSVDDFVLPSPDYLLALPAMDMVSHVGLANLPSDTDGAVRRFSLREVNTTFARQEQMPNLSLGLLAAVRATGQDPRADAWHFGGRTLAADAALPVAWAGPPGSFHAVSFRHLLAADALQRPDVQALKDKVVVIGAGYAGMNDVHPTPYSTSVMGANTLMTGPEIQANIVETLLAGRFLDTVPAAVRVPVFFSLFLALAWLSVKLTPWRAAIVMVLVAQVAALVGYGVFRAGWLLPLAHFQIGLIVVVVVSALFRLTREERERARIGDMFGRYVSPQVVSALLTSPELPELGGQTRQITVLFSDIRNFTTLSEKLSAKDVVELLNTYFESACTVLQAEGATIDKFIGDAIMAEFGAPLAQEDHARRALRAALALRAVAIECRGWVAERFAGHDLPEFDIGIGLHTGEAVVGNIGSSLRMEYTAIGDTVNTASRLEGMTKPTGCSILASRDTVMAAGPGVRTGAHHTLTVKGRQQPVEAFELLAVEESD